MRSSIDLGPAFPFVSEALRNEKVFLYQRTEQGAVLAVGEHERLEQPRFRGHRASDWCFGHMSYAQRHPAFGLPSPPTANNAWPIERWFGLSHLIVHTSGTHNSMVTLPGLHADLAAAMRETIRRHIQTDFA